MNRVENFLSQVKDWAWQHRDIGSVLLVGSYARGTARADSDVDLVVLTTQPANYTETISFAEKFGEIVRWQIEGWGKVTSVRVWYHDELEVEFGFALPDWAVRPLDPGTRRVLEDGARLIFDRDNELGWLSELRDAHAQSRA